MFFCSRSVIVICKNMSSSDLEKLVPSLSKSCMNKEDPLPPAETLDGSLSTTTTDKPKARHCLNLAGTSSLSREQLLVSSSQSGNGSRGGGNSSKKGGKKCDEKDVRCKILNKVTSYLKKKIKRPQGKVSTTTHRAAVTKVLGARTRSYSHFSSSPS